MHEWHRFLKRLLPTVTAALLVACGSGNDDPAVEETPPVVTEPERQIVLAGALDRPGPITMTALKALPAITQAVSYQSGTTPQSKTYTGPTLWNLLDQAGVQLDAARKNDVLNRYVVATGSDGYKAVFAMGEINPSFGNRESVVAHTETVDGAQVALTTDGPLRVTSPGDVRGGRYVSDLVSLELRPSGSTVAATDGLPSTRFTVSGAVDRPGTFDLAALQALPTVTQTVGTSVYRGVSLWELLNTTAGIKVNPAVRNDILGLYVVGTGSDGYKALLSMGEINPSFGNQPNLVAWEIDGELLDASGFARLVVPNDARAGRHVSNLITLEVFAAPAAAQ